MQTRGIQHRRTAFHPVHRRHLHHLGEYGTGHWALVNDNQLKLTNIYGQVLNIFDGSSTPMTIVSLTKDCLTLEDPDQTMQVDFYHQR